MVGMVDMLVRHTEVAHAENVLGYKNKIPYSILRKAG